MAAASGFVSVRRSAARSARARRSHAAAGAPSRPGPSPSVTTRTIEAGAAGTSGGSKKAARSHPTRSFACASRSHSCTGWNDQPTLPFRDDTDNRSGGCRYAWKIESRTSTGARNCRVCFKETEGSSQCQGSRNSCSGWTTDNNPAWTASFRDDTDNRSGGCTYQWYLECK